MARSCGEKTQATESVVSRDFWFKGNLKAMGICPAKR